jgi:uncharacterized protein (DUF362 family)
MKSRVSVIKVKTGVIDAVQEAMAAAGVLEAVPAGASVCVKPNLGFDLFFPGAVTSPWVVEGVIRGLRERAGEICVVESDQVLVNIEKAMRRAGFERVLRDCGVRFVNMSKGKFVEVPVPKPHRLTSLRMPEILTRSTLVTVPVIKTHDKTGISVAIKNQWGCLDVLRHNYHLCIDDVLTDIHQVLKPAFAVCDATVGLEGDGPKTGHPRRVDRILASRDLVALDAVAARIMGFDPDVIRHLQLLTDAGIGSARDYEVVGEDIAGLNFHFRPAGHNAVSVVELALRQSWLRRLVFETPVLDLMCWGATVWYLIWYYAGPGARIRDEIIKDTIYGGQWR